MTTLERFEAAAIRVGGADAPQRLQQKIEEANYPISLHALADLLVARADTSHAPDAVLDAVVKVLLRPNIPLMVPDAILGMAGLAIAELKMRHEAQAVLDSLDREHQQGRRFTETSAFLASITPTPQNADRGSLREQCGGRHDQVPARRTRHDRQQSSYRGTAGRGQSRHF